MSFLLFYITHPDENSARELSDALLREKLVACANIFPVSSAYWWQGEITSDNEWVSVVKTRIDLEQALENFVQKTHPYSVPCILRFEVRANEAYERWIEESTR